MAKHKMAQRGKANVAPKGGSSFPRGGHSGTLKVAVGGANEEVGGSRYGRR